MEELLIDWDSESKKTIGIWKFCFKTKKWNKLFDFNYPYVNATLSSNENYLIITGGYKNLEKIFKNKIFILDLINETKYKLKKCKIKTPKPGRCMLVQMNVRYEILVIGWIKELFKTKEFKDLILPPIYLLKMISSWYDEEVLHWFGKEQNDVYNHQKIALKYILSNL